MKTNDCIITIIGARPQFIKAAPVSRILRENGIQEKIINSNQHYNQKMSDVFFDELSIPRPDWNLGIGSALHGAQTGKMLIEIEQILSIEKPAGIIVFGDTNTTLAGALAASKLHIPIFHIEAGLRSFNRKMPEEINRIATDHISDILFTPTSVSTSNLTREGIPKDKVFEVGDVMLDATLMFESVAQEKSGILKSLRLQEQNYILFTAHRPVNVDNPENMKLISEFLIEVSKRIPVVFPIHPRTMKMLNDCGENRLFRSPSIKLIDPVGYLDMIKLEKHAKVIVTDSGGVQKEAFFHRVPCVTLRSETEWVELVDLEWNHLLPLAPSMLEMAEWLVSLRPGKDVQTGLYGGGKASEKITQVIMSQMEGTLK